MVNQSKNTEKKFYIPVPNKADASNAYMSNYADYDFIEVTEEVYKTFYRPVWAAWRSKKRNGCCDAEDWRRCLGDCATCSHYHRGADILSLDAPTKADDGETYGDTIADPDSLVDTILAESLALEELLSALEELVPDGRAIGELLIDGASGSEVCRRLNLADTTYRRRLKKIQNELKNYSKNFF